VAQVRRPGGWGWGGGFGPSIPLNTPLQPHKTKQHVTTPATIAPLQHRKTTAHVTTPPKATPATPHSATPVTTQQPQHTTQQRINRHNSTTTPLLLYQLRPKKQNQLFLNFHRINHAGHGSIFKIHISTPIHPRVFGALISQMHHYCATYLLNWLYLAGLACFCLSRAILCYVLLSLYLGVGP